jgi:hypothetical protein
LPQLRRERNYWDSGHPTACNALDLDNEIEQARTDISAAPMRVDSLTEEVRLGLMERSDLLDKSRAIRPSRRP